MSAKIVVCSTVIQVILKLYIHIYFAIIILLFSYLAVGEV